MLTFDPANPFPLVDPQTTTILRAQAHAAEADAWLGLRTLEIERALESHGSKLKAPRASSEHQQLWFGLDVQSLLTPYTELRHWLQRLAPREAETVVDLGAAYGRMGFVLARHFPGVRFVGYEYVGERVNEGRRALQRFGVDGRLEHADLNAITPVEAEHYFIYDFGTIKAIEKTLHDLRRLSRARPINVIVRGRHCRALIAARHPWLRSACSGEAEMRASWYSSADVSRPRPSTPVADAR